MTTLVFTNYNFYLSAHQAFCLKKLRDWAHDYGCKFFIRRLDSTEIFEDDAFIFSSIKPTENQLKEQISCTLKQIKPKKVVNFLEYFFPWHLVETDAEKIYFVRNCNKKVVAVLKEQNAPIELLKSHIKLAELETQFIKLSNKIIVDSINSQQTIETYYDITPNVCLEFVDPRPFSNMKITNKKDSVYNVGRRDFQKGLHLLTAPNMYKFYSIGKNEVDSLEYVQKNIVKLSCLKLNEYKEILNNCFAGVFPSLWESNGYAVQEALAMGKIPVIRKGSGGNERLCINNVNSLVDDFTSWEEKLKDSSIRAMQDAAKSTLTYDMYKASADKFGDIIC